MFLTDFFDNIEKSQLLFDKRYKSIIIFMLVIYPLYKTPSMRKTKIWAILSLGVLASSLLLTTVSQAADTTVNMQITAWAVTYGAPTALTFGTTLTTSFAAQTLAQDFSGAANYFWIQDLKGADSGYNTTLQLSGNLVAWSNTITWSNVSFRSVGSIVTVSGTTNTSVVFDAATTAYQALNTSRTFIRRNSGANLGRIGYYGGNINLQVNVPAGQPAGSYAGTLVYTLIEN